MNKACNIRDVYNISAAKTNRQEIESVRRIFSGHFIGRNYTFIEAEPLVPRTDKTVLYSNATITPIKPMLERKQKPDNGWVIDQPCLRLQNLSNYPNPDFDPEYMSFFHMVGIYMKDIQPDKCDDIVDVLQKCGLPPERISLMGCHRDQDMLDKMASTGGHNFACIVKERHEGYFDWKYDLGNVRGRGIHVMVKQDEGKPRSIGQVVELYDGTDIIGYEFGFGVETFLSSCQQTTSIFDKGAGREVIQWGSSTTNRQYQDLLVSTMAMHAAGVSPGKGGRESLLRKALHQLTTIESLEWVTPVKQDEAISLMKEITFAIGGGDTTTYWPLIEKHREKLKSDIDAFLRYQSERSKEASSGNISIDYANKKTASYLDSLNFLPELKSKMMSASSASPLKFQMV